MRLKRDVWSGEIFSLRTQQAEKRLDEVGRGWGKRAAGGESRIERRNSSITLESFSEQLCNTILHPLARTDLVLII